MHGTSAGGVVIYSDVSALLRLRPGDIINLTEAATAATFYHDDLTAEQIAANRRVVAISCDCCTAAARNGHQHFAAAFVEDRFAGYMIATRHGDNDLELDWLMVHPDHHGAGVAAVLMDVGIAWLGADKPMWLNVIRRNERAIHFYRRFGFEIDARSNTSHVVPHWIMRRPAGGNAK